MKQNDQGELRLRLESEISATEAHEYDRSRTTTLEANNVV
jgi:hypothetical protein